MTAAIRNALLAVQPPSGVSRVSAAAVVHSCVLSCIPTPPHPTPSHHPSLSHPVCLASCILPEQPQQRWSVHQSQAGGRREEGARSEPVVIVSSFSSSDTTRFQMVSNLHHSSAPSCYSLLLKCNLLRITEHPLEI